MFNTSDKSRVKESILVIATKDDIDLSLGDFSEAAVNENMTKTGDFKDLLEKLKRIPPRDRTMSIQVYELRNKM